MARRTLVLAVAIFASSALYAQTPAETNETIEETRRMELPSGYVFTWRVDGDEIEATISAPTTGWVALGWNPVRQMQGATIVIGYVQGNSVSIRHDWGHVPTGHRDVTAAGGVSRITALGGSERDGRTELSFRMPLDPGDQLYAPLRVGESNAIIWAFGANGGNNFTAYHAQRGTITVEF